MAAVLVSCKSTLHLQSPLHGCIFEIILCVTIYEPPKITNTVFIVSVIKISAEQRTFQTILLQQSKTNKTKCNREGSCQT